MRGITICLQAVAAATQSSADTITTEILRCTSPLLGAPVYRIDKVDPEEGSVFYRLVKTPNNPFYGPYVETVTPPDVIAYGDATILTANRGRSGYALVYDRGAVTVIDVNLFQNPEMNTDGPRSEYTCDRGGGTPK